MSFSTLRRIATHLLAVVAGGGCYLFTATEADTPTSARPQRHLSRVSTCVPEDDQLALADMTKTQKESEQPWNDQSYGTQSIRQLALKAIAEQPEIDQQNRVELNRLLALTANYRSIDDLKPTLIGALIKNEEDAACAIFLEWHRRNPEGAFDVLARHKGWCNECLYPAVFLHLSNDEIIAQAARQDRPDDFRQYLVYHLGSKLAGADDLKTLSNALQHLDESQRKSLVNTFVDSWVPDDGVAAARFISQKMTKAHRTLLLQAIARDYQPGGGMCGMGGIPFSSRPTLPHFAWTDDFSAALLDAKLDVPDKLLTELRDRAASTDLTLNDTFPVTPSAPDALQSGMDPATAFHLIKQLVGEELFRRQDYPELFARGALSAQEITSAMQWQIEGVDAYPETLARAIYPHLAPHHASNASTWARTNIAPGTLREDTIELLTSLTGSNHEPRADRIAEWVQVFQPDFPEGRKSRHLSERFLTHFKKWAAIHPEAAAKATSPIDPNHPIWSHQ